jgi:hypothetical protein
MITLAEVHRNLERVKIKLLALVVFSVAVFTIGVIYSSLLAVALYVIGWLLGFVVGALTLSVAAVQAWLNNTPLKIGAGRYQLLRDDGSNEYHPRYARSCNWDRKS